MRDYNQRKSLPQHQRLGVGPSPPFSLPVLLHQGPEDGADRRSPVYNERVNNCAPPGPPSPSHAKFKVAQMNGFREVIYRRRRTMQCDD